MEKFLDRLGRKPQRVERGENPPDFYLHLDSNRIAVELTEFHSDETGPGGHPRRMVEEAWQDIQNVLRKMRKDYPQLNGVYGYLFFKALEVPPSRQHEQFVRELFVFSQQHLSEVSKQDYEYKHFPKEFPLLERYLKELHLSQVGEWEWNYVGGWGGISEEELKNTIVPKLQKPRPSDIMENWLLVVGGYHMPQFMGIPHVGMFNNFNEVNVAIEAGPYDKLYVFQYMLNRILCWQQHQGWVEVKKPRREAIQRLKGADK